MITFSKRAQPYPSSQKHFALSGTCLRVGVNAPRTSDPTSPYESTLHRRYTQPLQPRIATPYNFVTARSAFRIPLSFHAAGSDVYATRRHSASLLPRGDKIRRSQFRGVPVQLTNSRCKRGNPHVSSNIDTYLRKHVNLWNIDDVKLLPIPWCCKR